MQIEKAVFNEKKKKMLRCFISQLTFSKIWEVLAFQLYTLKKQLKILYFEKIFEVLASSLYILKKNKIKKKKHFIYLLSASAYTFKNFKKLS